VNEWRGSKWQKGRGKMGQPGAKLWPNMAKQFGRMKNLDELETEWGNKLFGE
jgi:hypothetical protein